MRTMNIVMLILFAAVFVYASPDSAVFYVSPGGSDANPGTPDKPFASLEAARDAARQAAKYAVIYLREGAYSHSTSLELSRASCGDTAMRFEAYPGEMVRISGGVRLEPKWFSPMTPANEGWNRLAETAQGRVLFADLQSHGITDYGKFRPRGFFDKKPAHAELFFNNQRMLVARWPNEGFVKTGKPMETSGFEFSRERMKHWSREKDPWAFGFWMYEWAGGYLPVDTFDAEAGRITFKAKSSWGLAKGKHWYAVNLLCELDAPGEWYLDRDTGELYLWPPAEIKNAELYLSMLGENGEPLVRITDASNVTFKGLVFENCRASAVAMEGGSNNRIESCVLRNTGMAAALITGGTVNGVIDSHIHDTGDQAVTLWAGDRRTLTDSRNFVRNCYIHHTGRWTRTASPAVLLMGCGHTVSHNVIHDIPHSAIQYLYPPGGNNNTIEYNEIYRACYEVEDAGAIYDAWDWGARGHVIRYNYIHDIHGFDETEFGNQAIYLDGFISGYEIYGNIFYDIQRAGIMINGGRDTVIDNNIFIKCKPAVYAARSGTVGITRDGNFTDLLQTLRGYDYTNLPWSMAFPWLSNIPDDYDAPGYELAKEPSGTVVARNLSWNNTDFLVEGHYPGGDVIGQFRTVKDNLTEVDPGFVDEAAGNLALRADSPAFTVPGFEPIPFEKIGTQPAAPRVVISGGFHEDWKLNAVFIKGTCEPWCKIKTVKIIESDTGYTNVLSLKDNGMFSGLIPTVAINTARVTVEVITQDPQGQLSKPGISNTIEIAPDDSNLVGEVYIDPETGVRMRGPVEFEPFVWPDEAPADFPFKKSGLITDIKFLGIGITYTGADTWYPSWAQDGNLYSPWTDGKVQDDFGQSGWADSVLSHTGQGVIIGDDPLNLIVRSLGTFNESAVPYGGRYPCGSLLHNGIWYYGTYGLINKPDGYNWGTLGPCPGFRISTDYGQTWTASPHSPAKPLFNEQSLDGGPVKIGAPHFVDFGRNMEHSPDGKAYLVAHGASRPDPKPRPANLSWITGDQIYLIRVTPSIETINDASAYEFFAGYDVRGRTEWTKDFDKMRPLIEWNNNCGCVTMTYNAPLKKYLLCVTDGWPTLKTMNTWILESDTVAGPWKRVTYMKSFGEQAYFVNIPTRFISPDGRTAWLCYSGNFTRDQAVNPPGGSYGMSLQKIELLGPEK